MRKGLLVSIILLLSHGFVLGEDDGAADTASAAASAAAPSAGKTEPLDAHQVIQEFLDHARNVHTKLHEEYSFEQTLQWYLTYLIVGIPLLVHWYAPGAEAFTGDFSWWLSFIYPFYIMKALLNAFTAPWAVLGLHNWAQSKYNGLEKKRHESHLSTLMVVKAVENLIEVLSGLKESDFESENTLTASLQERIGARYRIEDGQNILKDRLERSSPDHNDRTIISPLKDLVNSIQAGGRSKAQLEYKEIFVLYAFLKFLLKNPIDSSTKAGNLFEKGRTGLYHGEHYSLKWNTLEVQVGNSLQADLPDTMERLKAKLFPGASDDA